MSERNVDKVRDERASQGQMGQRYLASGESLSMRLWENEQPGEPKPELHTYKILEPFTVVKATSPPAEERNHDAP